MTITDLFSSGTSNAGLATSDLAIRIIDPTGTQVGADQTEAGGVVFVHFGGGVYQATFTVTTGQAGSAQLRRITGDVFLAAVSLPAATSTVPAGLATGFAEVARQTGQVWRSADTRTGFDGVTSWAVAEAEMPFQSQPLRADLVPIEGLAAEQEELVFRCPSDRDVVPEDVVYWTDGDRPQTFWRVVALVGEFTWRANIREVRVYREIKPLASLEEAIAA